MKRRELLQIMGGAFAVAGALLSGFPAEALLRLRSAARRSLRVPSDLLSRIRRRTRPLDERCLDEEHDLAG